MHPEEFSKVCRAGHSKVQMAVRCTRKPPLNLRAAKHRLVKLLENLERCAASRKVPLYT